MKARHCDAPRTSLQSRSDVLGGLQESSLNTLATSMTGGGAGNGVSTASLELAGVDCQFPRRKGARGPRPWTVIGGKLSTNNNGVVVGDLEGREVVFQKTVEKHSSQCN